MVYSGIPLARVYIVLLINKQLQAQEETLNSARQDLLKYSENI